MISRRQMLARGAGTLAGSVTLLHGAAAVIESADAQHTGHTPPKSQHSTEQSRTTKQPPTSSAYRPVVTPNGSTLPWKMVDGVKVYHLVAEVVKHEFTPGLVVEAWGYNGGTPGPTIEAVEGDRVRIYVTNHLPEPTTVHWHGILVPSGMDGVTGLNQKPIPPGETFKYEFTLRQHGTYMYHPHFDEMIQMAMGMMGMFVIHPRVPRTPRVDRDYAIMLSEWLVKPGAARPDPVAMSDFNVLTMNSKVFPSTQPLIAKTGERVRIRMGNLSAMDHHPLHLHGYRFVTTGTDGGAIPASAQFWESAVLVPVGTTRDIEFVANVPGDWAFHCHMTHHVMNQMGHDLPNMIGVDTKDLDTQVRSLLPEYMTMGQTGMGEMADMGMPVPRNSIPMQGGPGPFGTIDMGGMFTIVKVRDQLPASGDLGWYQHPAGTVASAATESELARDGVTVPAHKPATGGMHEHQH